jgi:ferredoxin
MTPGGTARRPFDSWNSMSNSEGRREGSLEAPTRHALDWQSDEFYDEAPLFEELERVFDVCHGCRRCFNLCNSFPTLFDAVDESETMEVDGVPKNVYWDVVDHCYLCDMCYMSKCPYVPPHEWNIDFPHLMLRAKAARFKKEGASLRDKVLSATDKVGKLAGIPVVVAAKRAASYWKKHWACIAMHQYPIFIQGLRERVLNTWRKVVWQPQKPRTTRVARLCSIQRATATEITRRSTRTWSRSSNTMTYRWR